MESGQIFQEDFQLKIGIIGSSAELTTSEELVELTEELGKALAANGHFVLFGPEPRMSSLPTLVARAARMAGATTIGIANGSARSEIFDGEAASVLIFTDSGGGGSREVVLVNSCDAIIALGGGVGTLTEICIAYMNWIPIIAISGTGGWAERLGGQFLDERRKFIIEIAKDAREAVELATVLSERARDLRASSRST